MQSRIKKSKSPVLKSVRKFFISIFVMVLLVGAVGAGYIWYMGRNDDGRFDSMQAGETVKAPTIQASKVDENARVGVSLQIISSPVLPGSEASISVRTNREAKCVIKVVYDKIVSTDANLTEKTANEFGGVDWTWTVDSNAPIGKWPVTVTCKKGTHDGVYVADLVVAKSL